MSGAFNTESNIRMCLFILFFYSIPLYSANRSNELGHSPQPLTFPPTSRISDVITKLQEHYRLPKLRITDDTLVELTLGQLQFRNPPVFIDLDNDKEFPLEIKTEGEGAGVRYNVALEGARQRNGAVGGVVNHNWANGAGAVQENSAWCVIM